MKILLGLLVGLLWGAVPSVINSCIGKVCARKNTPEAITAYGYISGIISIAALLGVFLIIRILPINTIATMIGTALSMSSLGVLFALKMAGKKK